MQLSVWATRQAFRFRGRSICMSQGSRCCIIKSNFEGKEIVRKGQTPHPVSGGFVPLLYSFWGSSELFVFQAAASKAVGTLLMAWCTAIKEAATRDGSYGPPDASEPSQCHHRVQIVRGWGRLGLQREVAKPRANKWMQSGETWRSWSSKSANSKRHSGWDSTPSFSDLGWSWKCYLLTHASFYEL